MLQATFFPFVVSSIPLTRSGAVSNRTRILAEKVSLSSFCIAARCSSGRSNALRTTAGSDADLRASARPAFASLRANDHETSESEEFSLGA